MECPVPNCENDISGQVHHIIFKNKVRGGTDHPSNRIKLCLECHNACHHSRDTEYTKRVMDYCHSIAKQDLANCWSGLGKIDQRYKPKIIRILEAELEEEKLERLR